MRANIALIALWLTACGPSGPAPPADPPPPRKPRKSLSSDVSTPDTPSDGSRPGKPAKPRAHVVKYRVGDLPGKWRLDVKRHFDWVLSNLEQVRKQNPAMNRQRALWLRENSSGYARFEKKTFLLALKNASGYADLPEFRYEVLDIRGAVQRLKIVRMGGGYRPEELVIRWEGPRRIFFVDWEGLSYTR